VLALLALLAIDGFGSEVFGGYLSLCFQFVSMSVIFVIEVFNSLCIHLIIHPFMMEEGSLVPAPLFWIL